MVLMMFIRTTTNQIKIKLKRLCCKKKWYLLMKMTRLLLKIPEIYMFYHRRKSFHRANFLFRKRFFTKGLSRHLGGRHLGGGTKILQTQREGG